MGKHLWVRDLGDESRDKQPGCMWGLVHVLDYHHWQSNVKKMIHHRKHEGRNHDKRNWSPDTRVHGDDGYEKLLDEQERPHHGAKASRASKKRSLRARIAAIITEETSREDKDLQGRGGSSTKSSLQRTYSIHHLESVDDFFGKIRTDWNHPIIFLPRNSESCSSAQTKASRGESDEAELDAKEKKPDAFEIFKVDKELLLTHLQDSDESIANFSRSALGLNTKGKFTKSRSFPVADLAQRKKLKPIKLESKHSEVWSFPRDDKVQNVHQSKGILDKSQPSGSSSYEEENNGLRNHKHLRSSSLTESLDNYARLFGNSFAKDIKLSSSQSLKLTSEHGFAPLYLKRRRSLSYAHSYYSDVNFEVLGDNPSSASLVVIAENSEEKEVVSLVTSHIEIKEDDTSLRLHSSYEKNKNEESLEDKSDSHLEKDADSTDITLTEVQDQGFVSDSDIFMQETEHPQAELHIPKGKKQESRIETDDLQSLCGKEETIYPRKKNTDLDYVRHLLDRSGIATDASEMAWHASDQLFGPQLFEEVEAGWPHEEDQLDGWPDFQGCWHHQMLFDLVNEALLEVYDLSLPYYPKALSSSCYVRPFPMGDRIIEEVCTRVGSLMNIKPEEKQELDCIVARDLDHDRSWMNLQLESESIAVYLEDMIFNDLLQEVIFS